MNDGPTVRAQIACYASCLVSFAIGGIVCSPHAGTIETLVGCAVIATIGTWLAHFLSGS